LFLRLAREIAATDTFKPKRAVYVDAGFDPARTTDPLYVWDGASGRYIPLDAERHARIASGDMRF
jgi:fatty-acyl-CoA synthase